MLSAAMSGHRFRYSTFEPPDESTANHEQDRDQLCAGHDSAKDFAASGIAAQKLDEIALNPIQDHKSRKHLPIKLLALEQPHQQNKIEEFGRGFDQLRRFQGNSQRRPRPVVRQLAVERYAPEVMGFFSIAAAGRKTSKA